MQGWSTNIGGLDCCFTHVEICWTTPPITWGNSFPSVMDSARHPIIVEVSPSSWNQLKLHQSSHLENLRCQQSLGCNLWGTGVFSAVGKRTRLQGRRASSEFVYETSSINKWSKGMYGLCTIEYSYVTKIAECTNRTVHDTNAFIWHMHFIGRNCGLN